MRLVQVAGVISAAIFVSGCSASNDAEPRSNETEEATQSATPTATPTVETSVEPVDNPIPGFMYKLGESCKGFEVWTQKQFEAPGGGYGAKVRADIDGLPLAEGIPGNRLLIAAGWYDTGVPLPEPYASNPEGIQGRVWFYIPDANLGQGGWIADAGLRAFKTKRAPGNDSSA